MANCASCGGTIVFGGVREGSARYCNTSCRQSGGASRVAREIPEDELYGAVVDLHAGPCPVCRGPGPVDIHRAHFIWSFVVLSFLSTKRFVCCHRCAQKKQLFAFFGSGVLGWWGFPLGVIGTPIQLIRNAVEMSKGPKKVPSPELVEVVSLELGRRILALRAAGVGGSGFGAKGADQFEAAEAPA